MLEEGQEYTIDGDIRDNRSTIIRQLTAEIRARDQIDEVQEELRAEHPGLKELWDQYQLMLELIQ